MDSKQSITVEHKGIIITYDEFQNQWTFTLRNRERSVETLAKARQAIDRPAPPEKKQFKPIEAWYIDGGTLASVKVTSIARNRYHRAEPACRITVQSNSGNIPCLTALCSQLFPHNEYNDKIATQVIVLETQIKAIREDRAALIKKLKCLEIAEEPGDQD